MCDVIRLGFDLVSAVYIQCLANRYGIFARNLFVFFVYCKQKVCLHFDIHSAAVQ